jgi:hypothetical protein
MTNEQPEGVAGTATLTTPSDREIVTERVFDAPRERASSRPSRTPSSSRSGGVLGE